MIASYPIASTPIASDNIQTTQANQNKGGVAGGSTVFVRGIFASNTGGAVANGNNFDLQQHSIFVNTGGAIAGGYSIIDVHIFEGNGAVAGGKSVVSTKKSNDFTVTDLHIIFTMQIQTVIFKRGV